LAELLRPSVLAGLLRFASIGGASEVVSLVRDASTGKLLGAEGEHNKWAELLRLPVLVELPRLSVLSERRVATEQKTFFVRAFGQAGVAEAMLACLHLLAQGVGIRVRTFCNVRSGRGERG
jgi:hypothetical protein